MKVFRIAIFAALSVLPMAANAADRTTDDVFADMETSATCVVHIAHSLSMSANGAMVALLTSGPNGSTPIEAANSVVAALGQIAEADRQIGVRIERAYASAIRREAETASMNTEALDRQRAETITDYDRRLTAAFRRVTTSPPLLLTAIVALRGEVAFCAEWVAEVEKRG